MRIQRRLILLTFPCTKLKTANLKQLKHTSIWSPHNSQLYWKRTSLIINANQNLGRLRRNLSDAPSNIKFLLFKTIIRPKLEHVGGVWDPGYDYLTNTVKSVQNRSAHFILANYSITSMCNIYETHAESAQSFSAQKNIWNKFVSQDVPF